MAEPEVDDLDERLADDFARLGFRAGTTVRRWNADADAAFDDEIELDNLPFEAGKGGIRRLATELHNVQELLGTIVGRLDWIDAALASAARAPEAVGGPEAPHELAATLSAAGEILDHLAGIEGRFDRLDRDVAALAARPPASEAAEIVHRLAGRFDRLDHDVADLVARPPAAAEIVDGLAGIQGRFDRLDREIAELAARPPASEATELAVARVLTEVQGLGERFGDVPIAVLASELKTMQRRMLAMLQAAGATEEEARGQQRRLQQLTTAIEAMRKGLGV